MTKINLHEMFESKMYEHIRNMEQEYDPIELANMPTAIMEESYSAALNDLQGKVDGLVEAPETIPLYAGISTEDGPKATVIAKQALAEFAANAVSKNGVDK